MTVLFDRIRGYTPHRAHNKPLGARLTESKPHVDAYPLKVAIPTTVERTMALPYWHWSHDQGEEGACVGFGSQMERAVRELYMRHVAGVLPATVRFDPWWLWDRSKEVDEWYDTNPGDDNGTSVHAAYYILRHLGDIRTSKVSLKYPGVDPPRRQPETKFRVEVNRWATSSNDVRACIASNQPVTIGINWYTNFDRPVKLSNGEYWIGVSSNWGSIRGGHCVCIYGASDRRQAFKVKNSWGRSYPLVWLPYKALQRLLDEDGEATVATDA